MKVTGPNTGTPGATPDAAPVTGTEGAGVPETDGPKETAGKAFADRLKDPGAASASSGVTGPQGTSEPSPLAGITADIAADLKAGKLAPQAAVEQVMERLLQKHVGADAPPAVREKLRAALQETIDSDPFIAEKLRSLGE